jgi:hypothetical protein
MSRFITSSGVLALVAIFFYWASVARLRRKDPAEFAALGSPEALHHDTKVSSWMMADYMFRCRFMFQGDAVLATFGALWYISMMLAVALFLWEQLGWRT